MIYECLVWRNISMKEVSYVSLIKQPNYEPNHFVRIRFSHLFNERQIVKNETIWPDYSHHIKQELNTNYSRGYLERNRNLFKSVTKPVEEVAEFTVCAPMIISEIPLAYITEWIELNRHLGIDRFFFYRMSEAEENERENRFEKDKDADLKLQHVLNFYTELGVTVVVNWTFPVEIERLNGGLLHHETYVLSLDMALTHCLYYNLYSSNYIVNLALDEYFTFHHHLNYSSFLHQLNQQILNHTLPTEIFKNNKETNYSSLRTETKVGVVYFPIVFYLTFSKLRFNRTRKSHMHNIKTSMLEHRWKHVYKYFCKYLVNTKTALWLTLFHAETHTNPDMLELYVNENEAVMRSYLFLQPAIFSDFFSEDYSFVEPDTNYKLDNVIYENHVTYAYNVVRHHLEEIENLKNKDKDDENIEGKLEREEWAGEDINDGELSLGEKMKNGILKNADLSGDNSSKTIADVLKKWLEALSVEDLFMRRYESVLIVRNIIVKALNAMKLQKNKNESFTR